MRIKITNKIEQRVNEYQAKTGATKKFIASKVGISPSRMYQIFQAEDMMIYMYIRFAIFLNCPLDDLVEYEVLDY